MKCMTIVVTPPLKKSYEKAKAAESASSPFGLNHQRVPHFDEDITDHVTKLRDTFDPNHSGGKEAARPFRYQLRWEGDNFVSITVLSKATFEEERTVFLMQGKGPLGSRKLGVSEAENKSYLPAPDRSSTLSSR